MTPRMSVIAAAIRHIIFGVSNQTDYGDPFWSNVVLNMRMDVAEAVSGRYFRFYISANNTAGGTGVAGTHELYLRNNGSDIVTQDKTYAASHNAGDASKAFDGIVNGAGNWGWYTDGSNYPAWVSVDMGSAVKVDTVGLVVGSNNSATQTPKDYKIQYSNDNSNWFDLYSTTNDTVWTLDARKNFNVYVSNPIDDTGKTVTVVGGAAISTTQKQYGASSCYFDGSGDYLTIPGSADFALGTDDFTVELWVYRSVQTTDKTLIRSGPASGTTAGAWEISVQANNTIMFMWDVYTSSSWLIGPIFTNLQWNHIALTRQGSTLRMFLNGVLGATNASFASNLNHVPALVYIGGTSTNSLTGYIDDLRITKGVARYTANFAPAAISSGPLSFDPYHSYTSLLLRMNGADASTTFTDESSTPKIVNANNNAQLKTAVKKYGTASGYFDGFGDYLTCPVSNDFAFGSSDFTIEAWVYAVAIPTQPSKYAFIIAHDNIGTTRGWVLDLNETTGALAFAAFSSNTVVDSVVDSSPFPVGQWVHVAVTRSGTYLRLFKNGIIQATNTSAGNTVQNPNVGLLIGSNQQNGVVETTGNWCFNGYLDDLRITKGIARYTANFTPPPQHLLAETDPNYASVILAMHMDDAALTDLKGSVVTLAGGASRSAAQSKFGGYSAYLNGSNQHLSIPTSSVYDLGTSDFTIEMWVRFDAVNIGHGLLSRRYDGAAGWCIVANETTIAWRAVIGGSWIDGFCFTTGVTFVPNQWYHVALVRIGSAFATYIDGILRGSATNAGAIQDTAQPLRIGVATTATNEAPMKGYVDDLRITKGVGRYSADFTPRIFPFPNS